MRISEKQSKVVFEEKTFEVILDCNGNVWYIDPKNPHVRKNLGQFDKFQVDTLVDAEKIVLQMLKANFNR